MKHTLDDIQRARQDLLDRLGFDLYESSRFVEWMACELAGLQQTPYHTGWDGTTTNDERIEIKHANVGYYTRWNGKKKKYFVFQNLWGSSKSQTKRRDSISVFILIGNYYGDLRCFVIPAIRLINLSSSLWIPLEGNLQEETKSLIRLEVPLTHLRHAVQLAITHNENYGGIQQPQLDLR